MYRIVCLSILFTVSAGPPLLAQSQSGTKVLAVVQGMAFTEDQVRSAAADELGNLEMQRMQFEASYARNKHEILQSALNSLVEAKLLDLEMAKRGLTREQLLAVEVEAKMKAPSGKDVDAFYDANKDRLGRPKDRISGQIREFLKQQNYKEIYGSFIERLKSSYSVETFFQPFRNDVEAVGHPSDGPAEAPAAIVEFSDFECPFCTRLLPVLKTIQKNYGDKVRLTFRQFPLTNIHPHAQKAAEASLCADEQGRFWEMHDLLFQEPKALELEQLKAKAALVHLDTAAFNACLDSGRQAERIKQDVRAGTRAGVTGTPTMFINGRFLSGAVPYEDLAKIIDEELRMKAPRNPR